MNGFNLEENNREFPILKKDKRRFPFKLGTTSYIYPDRIVPNVMKLAPFFDEIELVLFESREEHNLPEEVEIDLLKEISLNQQIGFNIHLPIDIFLGDVKEETRKWACSVIKRVIERTSPLTPSLYTLHLDLRDETGKEQTDLKQWKVRLTQSLETIMGERIEPNRISIENLSYPLAWVEDMIRQFGFSICLDIGHILVNGYDLKRYFERYLSHTSIIHLHGHENGVDHLGIDRLQESTQRLICSYLKGFKGIVSIEVFSTEDLERSLVLLEERWEEK
ncbi:MAG: sugar phosphate isomerase/epimerase [Deltaproteobacteria bacterium]|nr:sugar phosphate isomerase/epimerase [Deltaproteobacteria bacterium]MBM4322390.1 sugar phosphate isomerase/epimerase [Deltaproteobacteria bacterium]